MKWAHGLKKGRLGAAGGETLDESSFSSDLLRFFSTSKRGNNVKITTYTELKRQLI